MTSPVHFIAANMPRGMAQNITNALHVEGSVVVQVPTVDAAMDVLAREMAPGRRRYCVIRNPATAPAEERMWGFIISNETNPTTEFKETMGNDGYCVLEFLFTDDHDKALSLCKPAPIFDLPEGYIVPADGHIPRDVLILG